MNKQEFMDKYCDEAMVDELRQWMAGVILDKEIYSPRLTEVASIVENLQDGFYVLDSIVTDYQDYGDGKNGEKDYIMRMIFLFAIAHLPNPTAERIAYLDTWSLDPNGNVLLLVIILKIYVEEQIGVAS